MTLVGDSELRELRRRARAVAAFDAVPAAAAAAERGLWRIARQAEMFAA